MLSDLDYLKRFKKDDLVCILKDNTEVPVSRSEERRVGKSVDLGGRRIIKKNFFQAEDGIRDISRSDWSSDVCSSDLLSDLCGNSRSKAKRAKSNFSRFR